VSEALGTAIEDLMGPPASPVRPLVVRHALKRRTTLGRWNGATLQDLLPADMGGTFAALLLQLEKDGQSGRIHSRRSVPELAIVLNGSIRFELADSVHNLVQGDCICYDISVPHQWYNLHSGPTEVVLINTSFTPLDEWPEIVEQAASGKTGD
jgi:quercetin dioxygenase-like cupin family protein